MFLFPFDRISMVVPSTAEAVQARFSSFVRTRAGTSYWALTGLSRSKEFFGRSTRTGFIISPGISWYINVYRPFTSIKVLPEGNEARLDVVVFAPGVLLMLPFLLAFAIFGFKTGQWTALWGMPVAFFGVHVVCWIAYLLEKRIVLRRLREVVVQEENGENGG
jgi:hypothetical protein